MPKGSSKFYENSENHHEIICRDYKLMITAIGRYKTFKFQKIIQYLNNHKTPLIHEALDHQRLLNLWRFMTLNGLLNFWNFMLF